MNSRERRVIHIALRNEPEVRSESCGAGPQRGVVIYPASMASIPDLPPLPLPHYAPAGGRPEGRGGRGSDRRGSDRSGPDRRPGRGRPERSGPGGGGGRPPRGRS
jgi:spoIIIJ-associated protein